MMGRFPRSNKQVNKHFTAFLVIVLAIAVGSYLIVASHAATTVTSIEPETGSISNCASKATDTAASGSAAVLFGTCNTVTSFVHPGILVNKAELDFVKAKIAAGGNTPWVHVYYSARTSTYATKAPTVTNLVEAADTTKNCDPANPGTGCVTDCTANNVIDHGCTDETTDAIAAYTQALLWYYTGQQSYAQSAIAILNAYAAVLVNHNNSNGALQASWAAEDFTRAAEIIRHGPTAEPTFNVSQFTTMLNNAFLPDIDTVSYAENQGNWDLSAADAKMDIAIFTDNYALFDRGLSEWRNRVPAYIYLNTDGAHPIVPPGHIILNSTIGLGCFWVYNKASACNSSPRSNPGTTYTNGQIQEACRDFGHVGLGLGSMIDGAETAWIQGVNLYAEQQTRIMTGLSYTAEIIDYYDTHSNTYPAGFCSNEASSDLGAGDTPLTFEIAYNAYHTRLGLSFQPLTVYGYTPTGDPVLNIINEIDGPSPSRYSTAGLMIVWETLTHHGVGAGN